MQEKLFDSELKVMEIIWEKGAISAKEISLIAADSIGWNKNTTYTVIKKLEAKGFKPMIYSEPPEAPEGFQYEDSWEEHEDEIVQIWNLVEIPFLEGDNNDNYAQAGRILMGVEENE